MRTESRLNKKLVSLSSPLLLFITPEDSDEMQTWNTWHTHKYNTEIEQNIRILDMNSLCKRLPARYDEYV